MDAREGGRGPVVVGFDGSAHAGAALRYAIDEGARRGRAVRVVVAHEPPDAWMSTYGYALVADSGEIRQAVEDSVRLRVEAVRAGLGTAERAVPVEVTAVTGPVGCVLTQEARDASLLVVGHRGRGAVRSTLLGSVGLAVVLHAPCPVTVVRPAPVAAESAPGATEAAAVAGPLPVGPIA